MREIKLIILLVTGALSLGVYVYARWFAPGPRARRALGKVKATSIAELEEGAVGRVTGVVAALEAPQASPIAGQPCIGYHVVISERPSGGSGETWLPVVIRQHCQPFALRDDTGEAVCEGPFLIDVAPADGAWAGLPPAVYALLEEATVSMSGPFGRDKEFRFTEALLKPGDRVTIVGRATHDLDPRGRSQGSRQPPTAWHLQGSDKQPVLIADAEV
jgi:hypothetical protein